MERREWVSVLGTRVLLKQSDRVWSWSMEIDGRMEESGLAFGSVESALVAAGATVFYKWLVEEVTAISSPYPVPPVDPFLARLRSAPSPPPQGGGGG